MNRASGVGGGGPPFEGFVTGGAAVTLPAQLFVELLPELHDEAELRVTLYALYAIGRCRGALRAVRGRTGCRRQIHRAHSTFLNMSNIGR